MKTNKVRYPLLAYKFKSTIFILLISCTCVKAQEFSNRFFYSGTEIVIDVLPGNDIFYSHSYDKGTSIYSLAEVFQTDADKVFSLNKLNPKLPINDGKIVKVPIPKEKIVFNPNFKPSKHLHLPLYYKVKKGESLYRISKEYFDTDVESLKKLNRKNNTEIATNEKILIGFLLITDNKKNVEKPSAKNTISKQMQKDQSLSKTQNTKVVEEKKIKKEVEPKKQEKEVLPIEKTYSSVIIAMWDKKQVDSNNSFYVLNNEAKIGSIMEVYFPMQKTILKAKVLGRIPEGMYNSDIKLIVSPSVAKSLGVLDSRFMADIKYEK